MIDATTTEALAVAPVRLSPVQRIDMAERLVVLAGATIMLLRLPETTRHWLYRVRARDYYARATDAKLMKLTKRFEAFIREAAVRGMLLPETHACYVAPPAAGAVS